MRRFIAAAVLTLGVLLNPTAVGASVVLTPSAATAGSTVDLVFHVVNVQQQLATKQIVITFPASPTVTSTSASAPSGWSSSVDASTGTVASVVFSEGTLGAGAAGDFVLTTPMPSSNSLLSFKVKQTFTDNSTSLADIVSLPISGAVITTTTTSVSTSSSTSTTSATTSSTIKPVVSTKAAGSSWTIGRILIAVGAAVGIAMYLRVRRVRK